MRFDPEGYDIIIIAIKNSNIYSRLNLEDNILPKKNERKTDRILNGLIGISLVFFLFCLILYIKKV